MRDFGNQSMRVTRPNYRANPGALLAPIIAARLCFEPRFKLPANITIGKPVASGRSIRLLHLRLLACALQPFVALFSNVGKGRRAVSHTGILDLHFLAGTCQSLIACSNRWY
jgi:hypothetical protein